MLKNYKYFLVTLSAIVMGLVLYKNCSGKVKKSIPIAYDKQHIDKLKEVDENDTSWKERGLLLKEVDELGDSLAKVYDIIRRENGVNLNPEPENFVRINIKLRNGRIVQFDNLWCWSKIFKESRISNTAKVKRRPYGITLDIGKGDQILMLFGASLSELVTLIYIGKDRSYHPLIKYCIGVGYF